MHIRDLVFEAENIVDLFIFDSVSSGRGGDYDLSTKLDSVKGEMEAIIKNSKDGKFELEWWYSKADDSTTSHVVGLRPQIHKIVSRIERGKSLEIISIVGLPGTGKTTLAKQIYNDRCTKEENFEIQSWIKVGQGYRKRDFLTSILESLNHIFKEEGDTDEEALGGLLLENLQDHKYLIVMDDLWSAQALFDLQTYLPDQCNGSKIIVTTREPMVAKAIKEQDYFESYPIRLDPLSEDESWELFHWKLVGHQTILSKELNDIGKLIVKKCNGLPLAIAAIYGVLALQPQTPRLWRITANTLVIFHELYTENLMLRYNQLPPHLKACLLYIGSFPEDYCVPVHNLAWLLIAEGLVTDEVVAEGYISDLVDRCLVVVLGKRICGATKTCCISSLIREYCYAKVEESKFAYQASSLGSTLDDPRRLFVSLQAYTRISREASMQSLRSLLISGIGGYHYDIGVMVQTNIVRRIFSGKDFKLLKVLDLLSIRIDYHYDIGVMVHLTYLAVECMAEVVPVWVTNLFNLETLILSRGHIIYLPPGILKMDKLKRVCNKSGVLCFSKSGIVGNPSGIAGNLQTMYPLCGCTSCRLILTKSPRIRKLGLSHYGPGWFQTYPGNLDFLQDLEILKCNFRLGYIKLPSSIKRLTLRSTFLEWKMISILGTLPNLEVLKLLTNACVSIKGVGESSCWDTSEQEFPRLKCLKMRGLDITKWVDNGVEFKSLEVLSIVGCDQLRMLPSGLARAPRLHTFDAKSCNGYVNDFVSSIGVFTRVFM